MVNQSYSNTFYSGGTYDYFCMVHPWMTGKIIVQGSQNLSGINGSFSTEISSGGTLWSQDGTYTINASYGSATETKSFNFTVVPLDSVPFTSVPTDLTISIDKSVYTGYEIISIDTKLIGGSSNQPVNIQINDPVGDPLFLQTLNTNSQGEVSTQFSLPEGVVSGTYTVSVTSIGDLWNLSDSTAFMGEPLEPEVLESSISATNEEGGSVTTYNAGELGYFNTKLTTKSTSPILVTVTVLDAQQNTLGVGFFKTVLPKGDAEVVLGFEIPEGTISGDAQVFTNFFTDWPNQGGVSIGDEISATVNVIGIEPIEEDTAPVVVEQVSQMQVTVTNAPGSSTPGCEETNSCFIPSTVEIDVGGTVTWENTDNAAHTATAGTPQDGPSGHFDSSLIMSGGSYSVTLDDPGIYDYFCMVHPWMQGQVIVGESDEVVEPIVEPTPIFEPESIVIPESTSEDGAVINAPGSSTPGCEETNSCFLPSTIAIDTGGVVTWYNTDNAAHTATSGTPQDGPSGHFDSSLMMIGGNFSHTFDEAGTYDYFCMVHPWMEGQVVVGESDEVVEPIVEQEPISDSAVTEVVVENAPGSSTPGCEETNSCFIPSTVEIDVGGTVTWENPDVTAHTTTSFKGSISGIIGLEWDSGLFLKGQSFSHTFDEAGTYDYFCMVHPWMQGQVIVEVEEVVEQGENENEIIEVVDVLEIDESSYNVEKIIFLNQDIDHKPTNIIMLDGENHLEIQKTSLNEQIDKLTVSSWIKPDFIGTSSPQYTVVSKEGSFELFLTNTKIPKHSPGFSIFDGQNWNTILIDSKVLDGWHHLVGVINNQILSVYLDSILIGSQSIPLQYSIDEDGEFLLQDAYMDKSENQIVVGALLNSVSPPIKTLNQFEGSVSEVKIITDALTKDQILNLYLKDKDVYQRELGGIQSITNGTITYLETTESPKLSSDECIELAKERGLYQQPSPNEPYYTLVCQFPFDVIIPLNSRLLWIETLNLENAPYHSIRSVDNIFATGIMTSADMGFYDHHDFTYGVYEYYDDLNESLTGQIIIPKPTNSININEETASSYCANDYSCYDVYAAQIDVGETVTWKNLDTWSHTITSGTPSDGPDGLFDSGLIDTYLYFSHTFEEAGTYDYFCMVHPWKQGKIVVGEM